MNNDDMKPASSRESIANTSKRTRRVLKDEFKAKVALAALREDKTLGELSSEYAVNSKMVSLWKQELVRGAAKVFSGPKEEQNKIDELEKKLRLKHGFVYLTAIIDWYSRRILAWRLSNTLSSDFCVEVLQEAVARYGWPEVFNTDQGCQYTSENFTREFEKEECTARLSMDVKECFKGIKAYIDRYNDIRLHSSLDNKTPSDVYFGRVVLKGAA